MSDAESVRSLAVTISQEAAEKKLAASWSSFLRPRGLTRLALAYVPFATFDAEVEAVNFKQRYSLSLEAVAGKLDPYRTERDEQPTTQTYKAGNLLRAKVAEPELERRSADLIRREAYQRGFARIKQLKISSIRAAEKDFHVPFWLGFYGQEDVQLRVLNASTGRIEGRKACELFEQWLRQ
jgi:hypothetical protein